MVFLFSFLENTSCIREPPGHLRRGRRGGGADPLHPPPISAPAMKTLYLYVVISGRGTPLNKLYRYVAPDRILFLAF